ncbi:MAG: hypothetical protein EOO75_14090 [Myxococcales bacterium]|nr:MAG: hypothetical protein EOO75_14090 [Myxococcales bacterium]
MTPRTPTRVGHIGDHDNRFCGHAVFGDLARQDDAIDLLALAFGRHPLSADDRHALRVLCVGLTSPDARVWPLKLTRTMASYGNAYAGFHGAQLATMSTHIGPHTTGTAAHNLVWLRDQLGPEPSPGPRLSEAVARLLARSPRLIGFGVPFRPRDERVLGMRAMLAGHPVERRPFWRLQGLLEAELRERRQLEPNVASVTAALILDVGIAPHRAGVFMAQMMAHVFMAHALESAEEPASPLRELPPEAVDYQGPPPRHTGRSTGR